MAYSHGVSLLIFVIVSEAEKLPCRLAVEIAIKDMITVIEYHRSRRYLV